jgi:hypothetical protein
MNPDDREDLEAWAAQEPPADFAARVVEGARSEARGGKRSPYMRPTARRAAVGVLLVTTAAAGVAMAVHLRHAGASGDVTADARREVRVGSRAVAVLERGAHVAWAGESVRQSSGDVFWRIEPGSSFVVRTPGGDVTVKGTCFRAKVAGVSARSGEAEERNMTRRNTIFGAAVAASVVVGVYEGRVALSRDRTTVELVAGEQGEADRDGARKVGDVAAIERSTAPEAPAEHAVAKLDRARADRFREQLHALFAEAGALRVPGAPLASAEPPAAASAFRTMPLLPPDDAGRQSVDPSYIQSVVRNDYFPLAKQCYASALERNPKLVGRVEFSFSILGDPRVGGVVDNLTLGDGTTIDDTEMQTCMRESMLAVTFDAPPEGGEITITYPIEFTNEDDDAGGR